MTAAIITTPISMPDLLGTSPADLMPIDAERHDSTPAEARERADRLRAGIVRYAEMRQDIADAFACRDWIALGYDHWYAYVEAEFGEQLARLDRGERREAVGDLRAQGMSTRQIASATGMPKSTVSDAVRQLSGSGQLSQPERITGSDGKDRPASRPTPKTPEPTAVPSTAAAGSGSTSPEPEPERHLSVVPESEPPRSEQAEELRAEILRDSHRRAAVASVRSVVLYLTSRVLKPAELAERYRVALDDFTAEELRFAAETMAALAALKEQ